MTFNMGPLFYFETYRHHYTPFPLISWNSSNFTACWPHTHYTTPLFLLPLLLPAQPYLCAYHASTLFWTLLPPLCITSAAPPALLPPLPQRLLQQHLSPYTPLFCAHLFSLLHFCCCGAALLHTLLPACRAFALPIRLPRLLPARWRYRPPRCRLPLAAPTSPRRIFPSPSAAAIRACARAATLPCLRFSALHRLLYILSHYPTHTPHPSTLHIHTHTHTTPHHTTPPPHTHAFGSLPTTHTPPHTTRPTHWVTHHTPWTIVAPLDWRRCHGLYDSPTPPCPACRWPTAPHNCRDVPPFPTLPISYFPAPPPPPPPTWTCTTHGILVPACIPSLAAHTHGTHTLPFLPRTCSSCSGIVSVIHLIPSSYSPSCACWMFQGCWTVGRTGACLDALLTKQLPHAHAAPRAYYTLHIL